MQVVGYSPLILLRLKLAEAAFGPVAAAAATASTADAGVDGPRRPGAITHVGAVAFRLAPVVRAGAALLVSAVARARPVSVSRAPGPAVAGPSATAQTVGHAATLVVLGPSPVVLPAAGPRPSSVVEVAVRPIRPTVRVVALA